MLKYFTWIWCISFVKCNAWVASNADKWIMCSRVKNIFSTELGEERLNKHNSTGPIVWRESNIWRLESGITGKWWAGRSSRRTEFQRSENSSHRAWWTDFGKGLGCLTRERVEDNIKTSSERRVEVALGCVCYTCLYVDLWENSLVPPEYTLHRGSGVDSTSSIRVHVLYQGSWVKVWKDHLVRSQMGSFLLWEPGQVSLELLLEGAWCLDAAAA